jgi:hypothetical protein
VGQVIAVLLLVLIAAGTARALRGAKETFDRIVREELDR